MAGQLKRENPHLREDVVLIRALRDSNLPKFLADDAILFKVREACNIHMYMYFYNIHVHVHSLSPLSLFLSLSILPPSLPLSSNLLRAYYKICFQALSYLSMTTVSFSPPLRMLLSPRTFR